MVAADITTVQYVFIINRLSVGVDANIYVWLTLSLYLLFLVWKGLFPAVPKYFNTSTS